MKYLLSTVILFAMLVSCKNQKAIEYDAQGQCVCSFDVKDYDRKFAHTTDVNFMVTGDPQYNIAEMNPDGGSAINADSVSKIMRKKICCDSHRGLLIAGDLTHNARLDEYERYKQFIAPFRPFVFDGLGNHDFSWSDYAPFEETVFADFGLDKIVPSDQMHWQKECATIWKDVRDRERIPSVHSSIPNMHYSWDWEDIHLVQLNVFPGVVTKYGKPAQNPFNSIDYVKEDLEKHVGQSGRPVILIHHYGFDYFSIGAQTHGGEINPKAAWWTPEDRNKYWEILKPYNVIAIFSGHAHYCDVCYLPWDGASIGEENVGPEFIPTFVSGAAREGKFLECHVTDDSLIVKRFFFDERVLRKSFPISRK